MSHTDWQPNIEKWRRDYAETGYLLVENAVDADTIAQLRDGLERIESAVRVDSLPAHLRQWVALEKDRTRGLRVGQTDSALISNIMELPLFDKLFANFIVYPRILDILEALFETPEFSFHNYKCICKMPGNAVPFQWHRDLPYLEHTTPNLITCMICIDPMTKANGATVVCPGSHRIPHEEVKASDTDIPESEVPVDRVTLECPAGSAVLFHTSLIHGGGPNGSEAKRRNVIGIWAGPETYPTTGARYAYEFVMPRSHDPKRQQQIAGAFDY